MPGEAFETDSSPLVRGKKYSPGSKRLIGFEPTTSSMATRRSGQTELQPQTASGTRDRAVQRMCQARLVGFEPTTTGASKAPALSELSYRRMSAEGRI